MKNLVVYIVFLAMACIALNVWFIAINAPADFQAIYAAITGILAAVITKGRRKK